MSFGCRHLVFALRRVVPLIGVVICLFSFSARAYSTSNAIVQYHARSWQVEEGLPQDAVQALLQSHDGYLWVGTVRGLARFDGVHFKVFNAENTPELKTSAVTALCEDTNGTLWIGTTGGLTEFNGGRFISHDLASDPRGSNVRALVASCDGCVWIGTLGGLFQFSKGNWKHYTVSDGLPDGVIRSLAEKDDEIWIGTAKGLAILKNGVIHKRLDVTDRMVRAIYPDKDGTIWLGLAVGVGHLGTNGAMKVFTTKDGLPDNIAGSFFRDKRGDLWFGTYGGLSRYSRGKFTTELDGLGTFFDQVNVIREDKEGDIWVGTRDGLHELRSRQFNTYTRQTGLAHNNIMSLLEDRQGNVWVGTWGGGVTRLNDGGAVTFNWQGKNGLASDLVLGLYEDADGSILVGTDYEGGAFRFRDGSFSRVWSAQQAQEYRVIRVIYRDAESNLWFGARNGLILWPENQRFLTNREIRVITEDRDKSLVVATDDGVFRRKDGQFSPWLPDEPRLRGTVLALYADKRDSLWIGTTSNGLCRFKDSRLTSYTTAQGMLSDDVFEILEDDRGWLWLSCSRGIFRVSKKSLDDLDAGKMKVVNSIAYGKFDGMETVQCSGVAKPGAWKGRDGRLWFATAKGVLVTDPNLGLNSNELPPPVLIEDVIADKQDFPIGASAKNGTVLRIKPGRGDVEFHYTALSFQAPEKVSFNYKLEGVDADWLSVKRRVAYYNNLRPGNYVFRVRACNNDGVWCGPGASIGLVLAPHFYETWWFIGGAAIMVVAMAGGTVRYTTRRNMEQELRRLEKQHAIEAERIRIARDMHDEIGAKLTKISFLGAMAKRKISAPDEVGGQIDTMSQTARDVIRALDEIVWAVNPANDTLEHLATYLCRNATEFFASSPIVCQFDIPDDLPACRLGTDVRHNILLAAKEAMTNILKHSGATSVMVAILLKNEVLDVVISDNGHGFERNGAKTSDSRAVRVGNGLRNMQERLSVIGGVCEVTSKKGQGTRIVFTVSLRAES